MKVSVSQKQLAKRFDAKNACLAKIESHGVYLNAGREKSLDDSEYETEGENSSSYNSEGDLDLKAGI